MPFRRRRRAPAPQQPPQTTTATTSGTETQDPAPASEATPDTAAAAASSSSAPGSTGAAAATATATVAGRGRGGGGGGKKPRRQPPANPTWNQDRAKAKAKEKEKGAGEAPTGTAEGEGEGDGEGAASALRKVGYWADIDPTNALFEEYYHKVGIMPEADWEPFLACLRTPLPTTWRVVTTTHFSDLIFEKLSTISSETMGTVDGVPIPPPHLIPWYPGNSAWHCNIFRKALRKCVTVSDLHKFLITQHDQGNICRQEAVSMIPPLFLRVQPSHTVLDMCAAPGSKTGQILEFLRAGQPKNSLPDGVLVSNDADKKRCFMLAHQVKRLGSPMFLVTNHRAESFPSSQVGIPLEFDCILCDVPCTGDGTLRKSPDVWMKWHPNMALGQHKLQSRIAERGAQLLRVGGRMVYSTCSFNPIEDEAVVSHLLRRTQGALQLVDTTGELPALKRRPGISNWKVMTGANTWHDSWEQVPRNMWGKVSPSVFPPSAEEVAKFHLERCMRLLPHDQDTGGFFVAVLEKVAPLPSLISTPRDYPSKAMRQNAKPATASPKSDVDMAADSTPQAEATTLPTKLATATPVLEANKDERRDTASVEKPSTIKESTPTESHNATEETQTTNDESAKEENPTEKHKTREGNREPDPWQKVYGEFPMCPLSIVPQYQDIIRSLQAYYGLSPSFPFPQLVTRTKDAVKIFLVSSNILKLLNTYGRLKLINSGLKLFRRAKIRDPSITCTYRLCQESLDFIVPFLSEKRIVTATFNDFKLLLQMVDSGNFSSGADIDLHSISPEFFQQTEHLENGCFVIKVGIPSMPGKMLHFTCWLGNHRCRLLVSKQEKSSIIELLGLPASTPPQTGTSGTSTTPSASTGTTTSTATSTSATTASGDSTATNGSSPASEERKRVQPPTQSTDSPALPQTKKQTTTHTDTKE
ncbi:NOL1/NOP2/Sun domain family 2 [Pelomyxa schiedti]|nr:NOL1/NOP2/Sun domain family 2 [Pelomyxa schiedti]